MDFKLDDNNDLVIENNELILIDGSELVRQLLMERLQTFLGEWFLDTSIGIPYYQDILKKSADVNAISNIFKDEILETAGVIELEEFQLDFEESSRDLALEFSVRTEDGSITINLEEFN